jgi:hypothetical protein
MPKGGLMKTNATVVLREGVTAEELIAQLGAKAVDDRIGKKHFTGVVK